MKNYIGFIKCFCSLVFRLNYYEGIDKPNLRQLQFEWRISPQTAWVVSKIIWID